MVITERTDNTVVIQKEPSDEDIPNLLEIRKVEGSKVKMFVAGEKGYFFEIVEAEEALFGEDTLILYFKQVPEEFQVGCHIGLKTDTGWYVDNRIWKG